MNPDVFKFFSKPAVLIEASAFLKSTSAIAVISIPGVLFACERNIVANLPKPIIPIRNDHFV